MPKRREYVTQAEFARRIEVSRQYVYKQVSKGVLKKCRNGKLDLQASLDAIERVRDPAYESKANLTGSGKGKAKPRKKAKAKAKAAAKPSASRASADEDSPDLPKMSNGRIPTYADSKAMREFWLARKARQDFLRAERDLLPRGEVEEEVFKALRPLRESLLSSPGRMAGVVTPISDPAKVEHLLETEIRSALEEAVNAVEAVLGRGR